MKDQQDYPRPQAGSVEKHLERPVKRIDGAKSPLCPGEMGIAALGRERVFKDLVQEAEDVVPVHQVLDVLAGGPGGSLEEALAECGKGGLVHHHDLPRVPLPGSCQGRLRRSLLGVHGEDKLIAPAYSNTSCSSFHKHVLALAFDLMETGDASASAKVTGSRFSQL